MSDIDEASFSSNEMTFCADKSNQSGYEPLNLENGSKAPGLSPRNLKRQADFHTKI